jgi:Flp pilus assembly protein TadD
MSSIRDQGASTRRRLRIAAVAALAALSLAGCASRDRMTTGSVRSGGAEMVAADALGRAYAKNPKDVATAMRYAEGLQMSGRAEQSLAVMRKLAIDHPKERQVLAGYGKALAAAGELEPALDAVRRAQTPEYPDWKLVSAEAAILDQLGRQAEARRLYARALEMRPGEASVLSNLGMSHLLGGDLKQAETYLRQAAQAQGADSRVRQNLALVVGLQGRFSEAEEIASHEMKPEQAQANVAYLRSMLAQQNAWSQLKAQDGAKPATN